LLLKFTILQPKKTKISSKVVTLEAGTEELAGNKGLYVMIFLSWGIDYRTKNEKTKSGKITSRNFVHLISHCALKPEIS
jgi:hypothetical protein